MRHGGKQRRIEQNGMLNDLGWKAMAGVGHFAHADTNRATARAPSALM